MKTPQPPFSEELKRASIVRSLRDFSKGLLPSEETVYQDGGGGGIQWVRNSAALIRREEKGSYLYT